MVERGTVPYRACCLKSHSLGSGVREQGDPRCNDRFGVVLLSLLPVDLNILQVGEAHN